MLSLHNAFRGLEFEATNSIPLAIVSPFSRAAQKAAPVARVPLGARLHKHKCNNLRYNLVSEGVRCRLGSQQAAEATLIAPGKAGRKVGSVGRCYRNIADARPSRPLSACSEHR